MGEEIWILLGVLFCIGLGIFLSAIRIVRPTQRGLIERFGKYTRFAPSGFQLIIPFVERMIKVNITEQMVDAKKQEIITFDMLNAGVDAQVYFRVNEDEESVKASQYNVQDCEYQIVNLARTTLRNIIGNMTLAKANQDRNAINIQLLKELQKEVHGESRGGTGKDWGLSIVRTELKEIDPPGDVQATMNTIVKAENTKVAEKDFASAAETKADGMRRAAIKEAEGNKRAEILEAEGTGQAIEIKAKAQATAIEKVNKAANEFFVGNAQALKKLEVTQASLESNSKVILSKDGVDPVVVIGVDKPAIVPIKRNSKPESESPDDEYDE